MSSLGHLRRGRRVICTASDPFRLRSVQIVYVSGGLARVLTEQTCLGEYIGTLGVSGS